MCLTKALSSSFHNIFLSSVPLISFFSFTSVPYNCRGQMEACDFRHTQIKSFFLSLLSGEIGKDSWIPFSPLLLCVCLCYYITPCFIGSRCWRAWGPQTHFLIVLCFDWFTSLGQKHTIGFSLQDTDLHTLHSFHMYVHMVQRAVFCSVLLEHTQSLGTGMCQLIWTCSTVSDLSMIRWQHITIWLGL